MILIRLMLVFGFCSLIACVQSRPSKEMKETYQGVEEATPAKSMSAVDVYGRLLRIGKQPDYKFNLQKEKQFSIFLKDTRENNAKSWTYAFTQAYYKNPEKVDQLSVTVMNCGYKNTPEEPKKLQDEFVKQTKLVVNAAMEFDMILDWEKYFNELGPNWKNQVRVPMNDTQIAYKMRLSRGPYKCDGVNGYGYRFDLFI